MDITSVFSSMEVYQMEKTLQVANQSRKEITEVIKVLLTTVFMDFTDHAKDPFMVPTQIKKSKD